MDEEDALPWLCSHDVVAAAGCDDGVVVGGGGGLVVGRHGGGAVVVVVAAVAAVAVACPVVVVVEKPLPSSAELQRGPAGVSHPPVGEASRPVRRQDLPA